MVLGGRGFCLSFLITRPCAADPGLFEGDSEGLELGFCADVDGDHDCFPVTASGDVLLASGDELDSDGSP
jgi:hypothetical protein